ncbi:hypothetical protein NVI2019_OHEONHNH_02188 [Providencia alcalifaciens]|nr:hypothetical protein NVI2019_PLFLNFOB_01133 [Providencia alcalifaciens]CAG9422572.1 hypothetical protein NVI2019_OHEONHNH_02188 [Providencia alcalifaciens]CAG9426587.1 hypothetical protein NVI2019_KOLGMIGM_02684 [Providencia alcalifaciens]CAG9427618.1 hypothetical protein NVI2019_OGMBKCAO_02684 [Providencia alcalifaciens]CAG9427866.1 hypothetical protein NVI2019_ANGEOOBF_02683 [Providencia alcalifaciens]
MFFGIFIVFAGIITLLENYGVISGDVKWGLPLAIIIYGLSVVYDAITGKKKKLII